MILLFQGWRLDPILQFGQFLLTGAAAFFAFETIKLRSVTTEQAKRNGPIVDDERPVNPIYRAEIEPYETDDRYDNNPRLRGYDEPRSSRSARYDSDEPRSSRTRPASERPSRDTQGKRRTRPSSSPTTSYDEWNDSAPKEEPPGRQPRRRPPASDSYSDSYTDTPTRNSSRKRPSRPAESGRSPYQDEAPAPYVDYVDYQPIDEDKEDNWEREQPIQPRATSEQDEPNEENPVRFDY